MSNNAQVARYMRVLKNWGIKMTQAELVAATTEPELVVPPKNKDFAGNPTERYQPEQGGRAVLMRPVDAASNRLLHELCSVSVVGGLLLYARLVEEGRALEARLSDEQKD